MPDENPLELAEGESLQSNRGDERLCAICAFRPGETTDDEGRLVCQRCLDEREPAPDAVEADGEPSALRAA